MADLGLKTFNKLYPMMIRKYQDLIVDQNATEKDKINQIIQKLNALGKLSNDVVRDWNTVYQWAMNDGLATDVNNKIEAMNANGELNALLYNIFTSLTGDMTTLHTTAKDTTVNAINEVDDLAKGNQTKLGDLTTLHTTAKDTIINSINEVDDLAKQLQTNQGTISNLTTTDKTTLVNAINSNVSQLAQMSSNQGDITQLNTNDKTSIVNALKEVKTQANVNATSITNIGNASPKGTYATLAALQTSYPTGTTGIFVVSADNNWYYWNGSSWVSGGLYQPQLLDNSALYTKFKYPTAFVMTDRVITVNYQTKLITFASTFYVVMDGQIIVINNHPSIDISTLNYTTGTVALVYDFTSNSIKATAIGSIADNKKYVLCYLYIENVLSLNRRAFVLVKSDGTESATILLSNYTVDYKKLVQPTAIIQDANAITVNFTTKTISFATSFFISISNGTLGRFINNAASIDFSAIDSNANVIVLYWDSTSQAIGVAKIVDFGTMATNLCPILFIYKGTATGLNSNSFTTIGTGTVVQFPKSNMVQFAGRDYINFDFVNNQVVIPYGIMLLQDGYIFPTTNPFGSIPITNTGDGIQGLFFDKSTRNFIVAHYSEFASKGITGNPNIVIVASFWASTNKTAFGAMPVKVNGVFVGTTPGSVYDETADRLLLPQKIFLVDGNPLPLYKKNIIASNNADERFKTTLINVDANNYPSYQYFLEDILLDSTKLQNTFTIGIKQRDNKDYNYLGNIVKKSVSSSANTGKNITELAMGDSLTNRNIPAYLKTKLASFGVTVTMVGTVANQGGQNGEGREGWTYTNFVGADNVWNNDGSVITPLSSGSVSTLNQNPFLKLATATDKTNHPDWCFRNTGARVEKSYTTDTDKTGDFYIFDFANYLANHSVANPDVITIALSTNDILQETINGVNAITTSSLALQIMISQIKAALPNVKIGIIPAPAWGSNISGDDKWLNKVSLWIEQCMKDVTSYQATYSNLEIVPIWCHINKDWNFPYDTSNALSATNSTLKVHRAEYIHWGETGKMEYINALSAYVMNVI